VKLHFTEDPLVMGLIVCRNSAGVGCGDALDTTLAALAGGRLRSYDIRRMRNSINVRISTSWEGGFTGAGYTTDVVWEFDEARHLSTVVVSDDAPVGASADDARRLNDYFRLEFYPVLCSNVGS
jgi:hypothetical protein